MRDPLDMPALLLAPVAAALLGACGAPLEPISLINKFRVITVVAEPPEIAPGQQTKLSLHAFDPARRPGTADWATCTLRPGADVSGPVPNDCIRNAAAPYLTQLGVGTTATMTMPPLEPWRLSTLDSTSGAYVPVRFIAQPDEGPFTTSPLPDDDERILGFYRVRIAIPMLPVPPNRNPTLVGVYVVRDAATNDLIELVEGTPYTVRSGEAVSLRAVFTDDSRDPYCTITTKQEGDGQTSTGVCAAIDAGLRAIVGGGGALPVSFDPETLIVADRTELVRVSWLGAWGKLEQNVTAGAIASGPAVMGEKPDNVWRTDEAIPATIPDDGLPVDLWVVGRDGRGGEAVAHRNLTILPALK